MRMNLWILLSVLALCDGHSQVMSVASRSAPKPAIAKSAPARSTSSISLIVRIYRTTGANNQLQQFNISVNTGLIDFISLRAESLTTGNENIFPAIGVLFNPSEAFKLAE